MILAAGIVFLLLGETYFRVHYFGTEGLKDFKRYVPANLWNPDSDVPYDRNSFTGLKPQSHCIFKGKKFYINNFGFHDRDWTVQKEKGVVRIIVCGTSVSMGSGVGQDENYPKQLEYLLNKQYPDKKFEILNFSMAGYNIVQISLLLEKYIPKFDPDVILIESSGWIFNDNPADVKTVIKKIKRPVIAAMAESPAYFLFFAQAIINEMPLYLEDATFSVRKIFQSPRKQPVSLKSDIAPFPMDESTIRSYFTKIHKLASKRKVLLVALRPLRGGGLFESEIKWRYLSRDIGNEFGFGFIDAIKGDYGGHLKEMIIYPGDNHPNAHTHRIFAAMIFEGLKKIIMLY